MNAQRSRKSNVSESNLSGTFDAWLATNDIPKATAQRLMKLAGFSEQQREEHKASERSPKKAVLRAT